MRWFHGRFAAMEKTAIVILETLGLFIGLNLLYWQLFKVAPRRVAWTRVLTHRTRVMGYLLVLLGSLNWAMHGLIASEEPHFHHSNPWLLGAEYVLAVVFVVFVIEALIAIVFDFALARNRPVPVPHIVQTLVRCVVYLTLVLGVVPRVFAIKDLAGLFTGSAMVSIIIGLALQETLGNLFAGIAMQVSRPYMLGHWIKVANYEGVVVRADWRSVTIRTKRDDYVAIPHSMLAKMEIQNFSTPTTLHAREITVGVHYRHPPDQVKAVLFQCATAATGVEPQPEPLVRVLEFQDSAILYMIRFWITDFEEYGEIESAVRRNIWYQFQRAGLQIPSPIRDIYHHPERQPVDMSEANVALLGGLDLFQNLPEDQLRELAVRLKTLAFARGEIICRQGDTDATFYVIKTGRVEITIRGTDGLVVLTKVLIPGEFFGEFALLTGEPRTATVKAAEPADLLAIGKEDMRCMLAAHPQLATALSCVLAVRRQQLTEHMAQTGAGTAAVATAELVESTSREILRKILDFFVF